jgi:hypothetical protein
LGRSRFDGEPFIGTMIIFAIIGAVTPLLRQFLHFFFGPLAIVD